jgi:Protein of unknown function (DUF3987)
VTTTFHNIPAELRALDQWVIWRLEKREGAKPTKVPYAPRPGGGKAYSADSAQYGVVARDTWGSFEEAIRAPFTCLEPCDNELPVEQTGFSGIGFMFSEDDPYCGIDLDDTHGDQEAYARQLKIYKEFNSYSELSPSGAGLHIIIKGEIPHGRRRASIEVYSKERYFTMTGNVQHAVPIQERQELLQLLFDQMGGPAQTYVYGQEKEQTESDEDIIAKASAAVNGEKFKRLFTGDFATLYPSQSEADFALTDIIAFYTQNSAQIARIFRQSALGQRDKAQRDDYIGYMVRKSFDRQLPPVDIEGLKVQIEAKMAEARLASGAAAEPGGTSAAPDSAGADPRNAASHASHATGARVNIFPPGLLGEVAQFILDASPRPVPEISLAGAIALLSGITGRAYNVSGQGLNQYILLLAMTGAGKDAISSGISKLMAQVQTSVPAAADYRGPGELVSSAGLIKWLDRKPAVVSILGEIGLLMQQMASPQASVHLKGLERILLQVYSKSGRGNVLDPMAYSEKEKNTPAILSPSLTIIGESVPERFYEVLDEGMIASGLLPRFMCFEYRGKREYLKEGTEHIQPSFRLVQGLADLAAQCLTLAHNGNVHNVPLDEAATEHFREFEKWTTDQINGSKSEVMRQLWNRAHLKALKLAAVCAVGINPIDPIVTINETMWATKMVVEQTDRLIGKFETGAIGHVGGSENKQLTALVQVISHYIGKPFWEQGKCGINEYMHAAGVITESTISRKLICLAAFRHDKAGATNAIKRTVKMLLDSDELREVPKAQMQATYGTGPRAFVVANPARFVTLAAED